MSLTVDANVFVSNAVPSDIHHTDSRRFIDTLLTQPQPLYCPTLLQTEAAAAIARPTGNSVLALQEAALLARFPGMHLVSLTRIRARRAMQLAANIRLRGADAIYVGTAQEFGTTLITWDADILKRGPSAVAVMTPIDWLAQNIAAGAP